MHNIILVNVIRMVKGFKKTIKKQNNGIQRQQIKDNHSHKINWVSFMLMDGEFKKILIKQSNGLLKLLKMDIIGHSII